MSRQFRLYLTRRDSFDLKVRLKEERDVVLIKDESSKPILQVFQKLIPDELENEAMICLTSSGELERVFLNKVESRHRWAIDTLCSNVLELSNCYYDGKTLSPGRMYLATGYYNDAGVWIDKSSNFLDWAQSVFSFTKKSLVRKKELDAYCGQEAIKLIEKKDRVRPAKLRTFWRHGQGFCNL